MILEKITGNPRVEIAKTGFIVPHKFRLVEISQGYNGPWSHAKFRVTENHIRSANYIVDDSYSIDFKVPFGTEVIAAKEGKVYGLSTSKKFYEGDDYNIGLNTRAEFVILDHGDFFSLFSHLEEININIGDMVRQGEKLALTARNGWIGDTPHLHLKFLNLKREDRIYYLTL